MRVIKMICLALLVALLTFFFLLGLVAMTLEIIDGDSVLFAAEQAQTLDDVHAASCRVVCSQTGKREGSIGTGTVVKLAAGKYWIITNWHVVSGFNQFRLDFFRDGKILSVPATLQKSWHNEKAPWDFAVLTVDESRLAEYNPPIVPLGSPSVKPLTDRPIFSSGCSEGRWSMAWKGAVENYYGNTAQFYPAPKSGQSGSAIVQEIDGQLQVTGILTWRVGDERSVGEEQMRGGAIPITNFYAAATGRRPTGNMESIPPNAAFCDFKQENKYPVVLSTEDEIPQTEKKGKTPIIPAIPRVWPVQSSAEYFSPKGNKHEGLILFVFTIGNCVPCLEAHGVVDKLIKEGFPIESIKADDKKDGTRSAREAGVKQFPTFLLVRDTGSQYKGLVVWSGIEFLESKIRSEFSKAEKNTLPPAPKTAVRSEESKAESEAKKRERRLPKIDNTQGGQESTEPAESESPGVGNGDISPLIGGSSPVPEKSETGPDPGGLSPQVPTKPKWRRETGPGSSPSTPGTADTETGLVDKITAPLTQRLDKLVGSLEQKANEKLDTLTTDLSAKAEQIAKEKIDEMKPGIMITVNSFLWGVVWRAVIVLVIIWYGFYWMVRAVGLCASCVSAVAKHLPRIKIELAGNSEKRASSDTRLADGD